MLPISGNFSYFLPFPAFQKNKIVRSSLWQARFYIVNQTDQRLVFDPDGHSFKAVPAPGEGPSSIVVKAKAKPKSTPKPTEGKVTLPPQPKPIDGRGTLPPKPIDLDMGLVVGLPDELEAHNLWLSTGVAQPNIPVIRGAVALDYLKSWTRSIAEREHQVWGRSKVISSRAFGSPVRLDA